MTLQSVDCAGQPRIKKARHFKNAGLLVSASCQNLFPGSRLGTQCPAGSCLPTRARASRLVRHQVTCVTRVASSQMRRRHQMKNHLRQTNWSRRIDQACRYVCDPAPRRRTYLCRTQKSGRCRGWLVLDDPTSAATQPTPGWTASQWAPDLPLAPDISARQQKLKSSSQSK